jgi:hypothetical protein
VLENVKRRRRRKKKNKKRKMKMKKERRRRRINSICAAFLLLNVECQVAFVPPVIRIIR